MELEHSFTVPVGVDDAWKVLLDIERVATCMPGAALDTIDGDDFTGTVKVKVGPITVTYKGEAKFVSKDDATHTAVIEAKGKESRGSGTAGATVTATLAGEGSTTKVRVATDLNVTGRPAQFGRGVMAEVAAKLIDQFAKCLEDEINSPSAPQPAQTQAAAKKATSPKKTAAAWSATAEKTAATEKATAVVPPPAGVTEVPPAPSAPPATPRHAAEPIDLLEVAGGSVAKRLAPLGVVLLLLFIIWRRRSR